MTKNNILQQAGVSVLSQANQSSQLALGLLQ
jgi:flagellin